MRVKKPAAWVIAGLAVVFLFLGTRSSDLPDDVIWGLAMIGFASAQYQMGLSSPDPLKAHYWFQLAAAKENAQAQYRLGLAYEKNGKDLVGESGVKVDLNKALFWYRKAAAQDHAWAQYRLARFYQKGMGVSQDKITAEHYDLAAARQGLAEAQWSYGRAQYRRERPQARGWIEKAAYQGHIAAQTMLGQIDEAQGLHKEAYVWYALAARSGDVRAAQQREALADRLTFAELTRAQAMSQNRFESIQQTKQTKGVFNK